MQYSGLSVSTLFTPWTAESGVQSLEPKARKRERWTFNLKVLSNMVVSPDGPKRGGVEFTDGWIIDFIIRKN
jgi:hypothetical protein